MKNVKNEKAVSPVIGVILMVVITVIIAAVLAVFAFGIGGPTKAPQTQLRFESTVTTLTVSNTGGDTLILADERLTVRNAVTDVYYNATPSPGIVLNSANMSAVVTAGTTLAPGRDVTVTYTAPSTAPVAGDLLRVMVLDVPTGQIIADTRITVQ